jgi:hypothetical protein
MFSILRPRTLLTMALDISQVTRKKCKKGDTYGIQIFLSAHHYYRSVILMPLLT